MQYSSPRKTKHASCRWHIMLLMLIFGIVVSNVWQINNQAEDSFTIGELEKKKQKLEEENMDMTWKVSYASSLAIVSKRALELNLVRPEEISFLDAGLSTVAVAEDNVNVKE